MAERFKAPVLKTGVHFVDREFESRPLRQNSSQDSAISSVRESKRCLLTANFAADIRRDGRVVEGARLLSVCTP